MIGTYAAVLAVGAASLTIGQAAIGLCGRRRWSWLAPAVGLALLCAICWGTVRLPGHGAVSAAIVFILVLASIAYLRERLEGGGEALRAGWPVALVALLAASLPFAVEGHFGILGTSFNPDMSQHLLAAYRLAHGGSSQLLQQGYPLGPHSVVVALDRGLGIGLVQGFSGLSVAVMVLLPLTALSAFAELKLVPRTAAALIVGLAYVVASYFAQGAFKEIVEALLVLAFALSLREATRGWSDLPLRFVPSALLAVGAVYVYSFPGLLWMLGTAAIWGLAELILGRSDATVGPEERGPRTDAPRPPAGPLSSGPATTRSALLALLVFLVLIAPEVGRMIDFHNFETFNPNGPGLGNLFGQVSPFEALGIWPSGDFRLAPGDGAVPAAGYYLSAAFGLILFLYGVYRCWRRREVAVLAGLAAAVVAYLAARVGGTAYTAAKAIEVAAPLVALAILLPLLREAERAFVPGKRGQMHTMSLLRGPAATVFVAAAGACSLLALANAPIGPTSYSPALTGLRPLVANGSTLVLAPHELLADEHGTPFIAWELRGGRVCIAAEGELQRAPNGVRFLITRGEANGHGGVIGDPRPFPGFRLRQVRPPYVLWETIRPPHGRSPCPLIAVRQARQGPAR